MDKLARDSVAAVWEVLWSRGDNDVQTYDKTMSMMDTMERVMENAGITPKDVADWIRQDRLEIDGLAGVQSQPEKEAERADHKAMAERIMFLHYRKLHEKEQKFLESVTERIDAEGWFLSPKQKKWLFDLGRKYGV